MFIQRTVFLPRMSWPYFGHKANETQMIVNKMEQMEQTIHPQVSYMLPKQTLFFSNRGQENAVFKNILILQGANTKNRSSELNKQQYVA